MPGPFGTFAAFKWLLFGALHPFKTIGMLPLFRHDIFNWATKSTALACQNLMPNLDLNTCPMEGFDGRRLLKFLGLSSRHHKIIMAPSARNPRRTKTSRNGAVRWSRPSPSYDSQRQSRPRKHPQRLRP
jgi:hypothetical protein